MSDVYNPSTNLGTMKYPKWLRGGYYPSIFSAAFDFTEESYADNTSGVSSAFVCAEQSILKGKPINFARKDCIESVFIGPIASLDSRLAWLELMLCTTMTLTLEYPLNHSRKSIGNLALNLLLQSKVLMQEQIGILTTLFALRTIRVLAAAELDLVFSQIYLFRSSPLDLRQQT